jgi:hypothetical protein
MRLKRAPRRSHAGSDRDQVLPRQAWRHGFRAGGPAGFLVSAGDCVHQRAGIRHFLFDYSPDMEYLEIVSPADFKSIDVEPVCAIPQPTPWK